MEDGGMGDGRLDILLFFDLSFYLLFLNPVLFFFDIPKVWRGMASKRRHITRKQIHFTFLYSTSNVGRDLLGFVMRAPIDRKGIILK